MIGNRYVVPYLRHFPIWRLVEARDWLTGRLLTDENGEPRMTWQPHWYGQRSFKTEAEALRWHREASA